MLDTIIVGLVVAIIALNTLRRVRARYRRDRHVQSRLLRALHGQIRLGDRHVFRGQAPAGGSSYRSPAE